MKLLIAIAGLLAAPAAAPAEITIRDPAMFLTQLSEMGYAPEAFEKGENTLTTMIHLRKETLAIVLAGCEKERECRYLVAVGSFNDLKGPARRMGGEDERRL